jgi:hypothetical protein
MLKQITNRVGSIRQQVRCFGEHTSNSAPRVRRFYKNVDIKPHPIMDLLTSNDLKKANLMVGENDSVDLSNLSKIRENKDVFYSVTLDNKPIKTMYKDPLYLPSRALAIAIAEEWDQ